MKPVKLTWEKVDQIRAMYKPGEVGYNTIARQFGVSSECIRSIVKGKSWPESKRWPQASSN